MASGDILAIFTPLMGEPPSSNPATLQVFAGGSNGQVFCLAFDDTTQESMDFAGFMPGNYDAGGVTLTLIWRAETATTPTNDTCRWEANFMRVEDDADDLDVATFDSSQSTTSVAPNVLGEASYDDITFSNGDQMDFVEAGEYFRFRITRDADGTTGTDDMTGDAWLLMAVLKET